MKMTMAAKAISDPWRVGEFISSARRPEHILMLAVGDKQIGEYGAHQDFIRWVAHSNPVIADQSAAKRVAEILQSRIGSSRDHSGLRANDIELWDLCQSVIDDGGMSAEAVDAILFEVSKVYNHVSGGLLSYPTYEASVVIAEAERVTNEWVEDCLKEDREGRQSSTKEQAA